MRTLIILCGGRGKRLGALTKSVPKPLIKINNKEFIRYLFEKFYNFFDKIILLAGYRGKKFLKYENKKIEVVIEKRALGTAGAIIQIIRKLPSFFYILNADTYLENIKLEKFLKKCEKTKKTTLLVTEDQQKNKGAIVMNGEKIVGFYEKKKIKKGFVYSGFGFISKKDLYYKKGKKNKKISLEKEVFPFLAKKKKLYGIYQNIKIHDIGTSKGIKKFKEYLKNKNFFKK
ncbi:MAG: sugar phosphate nucleotidyltransferase [Candidatus Micrarchaeota archaeon]|nr:sugar phosphate nucleotidyltransferase [Candidatus Micrarchaeota archaeon]